MARRLRQRADGYWPVDVRGGEPLLPTTDAFYNQPLRLKYQYGAMPDNTIKPIAMG
jgi:hypothetical protein